MKERNNETRLNIYGNARKKLSSELNCLQESKICDDNKKLLREFQEFQVAKNNGNERTVKLLYQLRIICEKNKLALRNASKQDIYSALACINRFEALSEVTKKDYRRALKQFYIWHERPDLTKLIDTSGSDTKEIKFDDILTDEDIKQVLESGCRTCKEKAFVSLLHETGCRIDEFLNIKIKHIHKQEVYCKIRVFGKTGERFIPVVSSIPYLFSWLNSHPMRNDREAYLWYTESFNYRDQPLRYVGAVKLLKKCVRRAGLTKKYNCHFFRHSRATINASWMSEVQLCLFMGWTIGSKVIRAYVHADCRQLIDTVLKQHGLVKKEDYRPTNTPRTCVICSNINESIAEFCSRCGHPLTLKTAITSEEIFNKELKETVKAMTELMKNRAEYEKYQTWVKEKEYQAVKHKG